MSSAPGSYNDVVAVSQSLHENMVAEGRATNACFLGILDQLTPVQLVGLAALQICYNRAEHVTKITVNSHPADLRKYLAAEGRSASALVLEYFACGDAGARVRLLLPYPSEPGVIGQWCTYGNVRLLGILQMQAQADALTPSSDPVRTTSQARMAITSRPFMWDPIAIGELLEARAARTDSGSLRPGSRSLLEQVRLYNCSRLAADGGGSGAENCTQCTGSGNLHFGSRSLLEQASACLPGTNQVSGSTSTWRRLMCWEMQAMEHCLGLPAARFSQPAEADEGRSSCHPNHP